MDVVVRVVVDCEKSLVVANLILAFQHHPSVVANILSLKYYYHLPLRTVPLPMIYQSQSSTILAHSQFPHTSFSLPSAAGGAVKQVRDNSEGNFYYLLCIATSSITSS